MANSAQTKDDIRERGQDMIEKGKQGMQQAVDKGREMAQTAADKAKEMGTAVRDRVESGVSSAGSGIRSAAETIREHSPESGMLGSAASQLSGTLESTGRYLEEKGISGAAEDLTTLIRRNPIPSVLIGVGVGILLGQFLTSSRR
jgi:ElaB/YqjD/DUF883 family membrane-anchored ribosome-binding protein